MRPSATATIISRAIPAPIRSLYGHTYPSSRFSCGESRDAKIFSRWIPLYAIRPWRDVSSLAGRRTLGPILLVNIAVRHFRRVFALLERLPDFFREHHGAVFATRAAKRDRQVTLAFFNVMGHQVRKQAFHTPQKFAGLRKGPDEPPHFVRASGKPSKAGNEVRIRQKPHVKDQVRIGRHTVSVAEAHNRNEHGMAVGILEAPGDEAPQFMHIE